MTFTRQRRRDRWLMRWRAINVRRNLREPYRTIVTGTSPSRRRVAWLAAILFVGTVYAANWLVNKYGPIRVWPTHLYAPAGVYVVGVAFLLRDTVQRLVGQWLALTAIAVGAILSVFVSPTLALASACAFAASELLGLGIFRGLGGNDGGRGRLLMAIVLASAAAAAVDSVVFLWLAFHSLAYFDGQLIAKLSVTVLALPFVLFARKRMPTQHTFHTTGEPLNPHFTPDDLDWGDPGIKVTLKTERLES